MKEHNKKPGGLTIAPLPQPRYLLDADGYQVKLCSYCDGFGCVSQPSASGDAYEDVVCWFCNGAGRYMVKNNPVLLKF